MAPPHRIARLLRGLGTQFALHWKTGCWGGAFFMTSGDLEFLPWISEMSNWVAFRESVENSIVVDLS
jgi:hypothetical protein